MAIVTDRITRNDISIIVLIDNYDYVVVSLCVDVHRVLWWGCSRPDHAGPGASSVGTSDPLHLSTDVRGTGLPPPQLRHTPWPQGWQCPPDRWWRCETRSVVQMVEPLFLSLLASCIIISVIITIRAHSFPRTAKFRAEPRTLGFYEPSHGIWAEFAFWPQNSSFSAVFRLFSRTLTFFIQTTQKMTSMLIDD